MIFWLLWMASGWTGARGNPKLAIAERFNRQGLYQFALQNLDALIDSGQADPDVYSYQGMVLSMRGQYEYALSAFEVGFESERLNGRDGEAFAMTRFSMGDCTAVTLLEGSRIFGTLPEAADIRLFSSEIEVHRYCSQQDLAWQKQAQMELQFPHAVKTHLAAADLALDEGDIDGAWRSMFLSQLQYQYIGALDVYARIALIEGRYEEAFQLMQYIKAQRVTDRSMILKGLATLLAGDPTVLLHRMGQPKWSETENPHLVYLRMWAYWDAGLQSDFQAERSWLTTICDGECIAFVEANLQREAQQELPFSWAVTWDTIP